MNWNKLKDYLFDERNFCLILGHSAAFFFLAFSLYYYQERLLLIDSSYYLFNLLHDETFFIAHYRHINYFNQWLPLLILHIGGGLKSIMVSYSLAFTLFYYAIFMVVAYLFKNHKAALFMFVALMLTCRFKHFMSVTETTSTMALSFLFIGWVTRDEFQQNLKEYRAWAITLFLLLILTIGHPIIGIPLLGFTGVYAAYYYKFWNLKFWLIPFLVILMIIIRYKVMPMSGYENNKMDAFNQMTKTLSNLTDQWSFNHMYMYFRDRFVPAILVYLLAIGILIFRKKYLSAFVSVLSVVLFMLIIVVIYPQWNSINMMESYYTYIGFLFAIAIYFAFSSWNGEPVLKYVPIALIVFYSGYKIWMHGDWFESRLEYLHSLTEKGMEGNSHKTLYPQVWVDWNIVDAPWSVAMTTLIYSTLKDPKHSKTLYLYKSENRDKYDLSDSTLFLGPQFDPYQFKGKELPRYFNLRDDVYHRIYLPD